MGRPSSIGIGCSLFLAMGFLGGCDEEVILDDTGTACLSTTGEWPEGGQVFDADQTLNVVVRFHECLSSSCDTNRQGSCSVEIAGDQIAITSQGSYTDESGAGTACTSDCGIFDVTCETPPIPAGEYTVTYGVEEIQLTIPGTTGNYCVPMRN